MCETVVCLNTWCLEDLLWSYFSFVVVVLWQPVIITTVCLSASSPVKYSAQLDGLHDVSAVLYTYWISQICHSNYLVPVLPAHHTSVFVYGLQMVRWCLV